MDALDPAASSLVLTREFLLVRVRPKRRIHKQTQIVNVLRAGNPLGCESLHHVCKDCRTEKRNSAHG